MAVGFLQAEHTTSRLRRGEFERPSRDIADPQGAHEFQTRQSAQTVCVPFPEGRVLCSLTHDGVLHDRIAELVNNCCDSEYATKPLIQA
jgi:hypothetical protein